MTTPSPPAAADLVAALWQRVPPPTGDVEIPAAADLRGALHDLTAAADRAGGTAADLLAQTARAAAVLLEEPPGAAPPAPGALASPARLRLTRMERWLAARAAQDPDAEPAADLCLWVLEHLEATEGGGLQA